jgi:hypothetical protein
VLSVEANKVVVDEGLRADSVLPPAVPTFHPSQHENSAMPRASTPRSLWMHSHENTQKESGLKRFASIHSVPMRDSLPVWVVLLPG